MDICGVGPDLLRGTLGHPAMAIFSPGHRRAFSDSGALGRTGMVSGAGQCTDTSRSRSLPGRKNGLHAKPWLDMSSGAVGNLKPALTRIAFTLLLSPATSKLNPVPDFETFRPGSRNGKESSGKTIRTSPGTDSFAQFTSSAVSSSWGSRVTKSVHSVMPVAAASWIFLAPPFA